MTTLSLRFIDFQEHQARKKTLILCMIENLQKMRNFQSQKNLQLRVFFSFREVSGRSYRELHGTGFALRTVHARSVPRRSYSFEQGCIH